MGKEISPGYVGKGGWVFTGNDPGNKINWIKTKSITSDSKIKPGFIDPCRVKLYIGGSTAETQNWVLLKGDSDHFLAGQKWMGNNKYQCSASDNFSLMNLKSSSHKAFFEGTLTVSIAFAVGYVLYRTVNVLEPHSPYEHARKWLAWGLALSSLVKLPNFIRNQDIESFVIWLILSIFIGGVSFLVGLIYGVLRRKDKAPKISNELNPLPINRTSIETDKYYAVAWNEIKLGKQKPAIWGKVIAENDGDEKKANAQYIKLRVTELFNFNS